MPSGYFYQRLAIAAPFSPCTLLGICITFGGVVGIAVIGSSKASEGIVVLGGFLPMTVGLLIFLGSVVCMVGANLCVDCYFRQQQKIEEDRKRMEREKKLRHRRRRRLRQEALEHRNNIREHHSRKERPYPPSMVSVYNDTDNNV